MLPRITFIWLLLFSSSTLPPPAILHTFTSSKVPICLGRDRIDLQSWPKCVGQSAFFPNSCNIRWLPLPDAMLDDSSASLSLRTTLHGGRGRVGFGPKNVCFHVKNWSMAEAVHSASLSHIILARIVVTSLLMVGLLPLRGTWSVFQGHPISLRDSDESFHLQHPVLDGSQSWQSRMIQSDMLATSSGCVCLPSMPSMGKAILSPPVCSAWGRSPWPCQPAKAWLARSVQPCKSGPPQWGWCTRPIFLALGSVRDAAGNVAHPARLATVHFSNVELDEPTYGPLHVPEKPSILLSSDQLRRRSTQEQMPTTCV